MELHDIIGAKNVIVQILWGGQTIEFNTEALEQYGDGILIAPYLYQGKPLELNVPAHSGIICNLYGDDPYTGKRVSWKNLELATEKQKTRTLYYIKPSGYNKKSTLEERRDHERIYLHKRGMLLDGATGKIHEIMIHDISDNGVSFYAPASYRPTKEQVKIEFEDLVDDQHFTIKIGCKPVRTLKKVGTVFYGCAINEPTHDFLIYSFMKRTKNYPGIEK